MNKVYTKIVYNACYGGFSLSHEAIRRYAEIKGIVLKEEPNEYGSVDFSYENGDYFSAYDFDRTDPALVQVVEELGEEASGGWGDLQIRDVPAGSLYRIDEYDGFESVDLQDEYDWKVAQ